MVFANLKFLQGAPFWPPKPLKQRKITKLSVNDSFKNKGVAEQRRGYIQTGKNELLDEFAILKVWEKRLKILCRHGQNWR